MNTPTETQTAGANSVPETNKTAKSTKKSIWWKRAEHLVQHTPTGTFYARTKVGGKTVRASLETDVFTTAKDRLPLKLAELRQPKADAGTFADGRLQYEAETRVDITLKDESRRYRNRLVACLLKSWRGIDTRKAGSITELECKEWAAKYAQHYSVQVFNNTLNIFRRILELAGLPQDKNPAHKLKRLGVKPKKLELPTADQFNEILRLIETAGAVDAKDRADFVRFLAFSGCRLNEARAATWADVNWQHNELTIHCLKRRATSSESDTRKIPLVPAMRQLLLRLQSEHNPKPEDCICRVQLCRKPFARACAKVGLPTLSHHDMRHLFATFCIEAGLDIPTVSRWLGHSDGGALAMKVYGHLRREHSQRMAERITFGAMPDSITLPAPEQPKQLPETTGATV